MGVECTFRITGCSGGISSHRVLTGWNRSEDSPRASQRSTIPFPVAVGSVTNTLWSPGTRSRTASTLGRLAASVIKERALLSASRNSRASSPKRVDKGREINPAFFSPADDRKCRL